MKYRVLSFVAVLAVAAALFSATAGPKHKPPEMEPNVTDQESKAATTSIALRVRRVTCEDAYVAVPVTDAIMNQNEDGAPKLNFEAFVAEAVRISKDQRVEWKVESSTIEPHPTQQPLPETRERFDAFHDPAIQ